MGNRFASGKHAIADCDICGFQYKLKVLKPLTIKSKNVNILVCPECWVPDQPQLQLGMFPVDDPQGLRNPRPDLTYYTQNGSRRIQWGWAPVGGARGIDAPLTQNDLVARAVTGQVNVATT